MHELSIAQSIIDTVLTALQRQPAAKLSAVHVRIGQMTDVAPDALSFGFSAITRDTPLDGAELVIESVPIRARCRNCSHPFSVSDFRFICPQCFTRDVEMVQGDELEITSIEICEPDLSTEAG